MRGGEVGAQAPVDQVLVVASEVARCAVAGAKDAVPPLLLLPQIAEDEQQLAGEVGEEGGGELGVCVQLILQVVPH